MSQERPILNEVLTTDVLRQTVDYLRSHWMDENTGVVAATIQDGDALIRATSRYLPEINKWQHAEATALTKFREKFNREPNPSSLVVVTLSPCVHYSGTRHGDSCSRQLLNSGTSQINFGFLDYWQVKDISDYKQMGFDAKLIPSRELQKTCENLFQLFVELYGEGGKFSNLRKLPNPWAEIKRLVGDESFRNLS